MAIPRHLLFVSIPAYGHTRPAISIVFKLLQQTDHLIITFPISANWAKKIDDEFAKYNLNEDIKKRLRIVPIGETEPEGEPFGPFMAGLFPLCGKLFTTAPYEQANGIVLDPIQPPDVSVLDFVLWDLFCFIRTLNSNMPIFAFSPGNMSSIIRVMGPEELGGLGDVGMKADMLAKEKGIPLETAFSEFYEQQRGDVIRLIGLPSIYDYEFHTNLTLKPIIFEVYANVSKVLEHCNGVISTSTRIWEQESNDAWKAYYERRGRSYYVVGPVAPTDYGSISREISTDKSAISSFLDNMQTKYGERSVILMAFGTTFWSHNVEAIWRVAEIIVREKIPLIFVYDNARAVVPDALRAELEASENAMSSSWIPQNFVLNHSATGWFVTHCGHNSVMESLSHGKPMIAWPFEGDQLANAMYIGAHNVGYELLEVQQGHEPRPYYRGYVPSGTLEAIEQEFRKVLKSALGADGEVKRRNAEVLQEKIHSLWDEGGEARLEMKRFIADHLS